jgi:predicted nucleic acid-binding Zn ribbon protein
MTTVEETIQENQKRRREYYILCWVCAAILILSFTVWVIFHGVDYVIYMLSSGGVR